MVGGQTAAFLAHVRLNPMESLSIVNLLYLKLLLAIFLLHLLVFGRLALWSRRGYHQSLVLVFICLIAMISLRLWAPALSLGALPLWYLLRWGAWAFTLVAALLWLRHRRQRCRA
jgi:hypothetical protein